MPSCPEQGGQWESLRFLADALRKCPRHPLLWEQVYTGCLLRASEPLSKERPVRPRLGPSGRIPCTSPTAAWWSWNVGLTPGDPHLSGPGHFRNRSLSPISLFPGREDFLKHGDKKPTKGTGWREGHTATRTPQTAEWTATFLGYTPSMRFQSCPRGRATATQPGPERLKYRNRLHLGSTDSVSCPKHDIKSLICILILETRPHSFVLPIHEEPQAQKHQQLAQGPP